MSNKKNSGNGISRGRRKLALLAAMAILVVLFLAGREVLKRTGATGRQPSVSAAVKQLDTGAKAALPTPDTMRIREQATAGEALPHQGPSRAALPRHSVKSGSSNGDTGNTKTIHTAAADTASAGPKQEGGASGNPASVGVDSTVDTMGAHTGAAVRDSMSVNCAGDTLAPWVYPEPSGGLHRGTVALVFVANKSCDVSWRFEPDTLWQVWSGTPVAVERTANLAFKAIDRCGRVMATRVEYYEITDERTDSLCPQNMELIKIGATQFCIDRYEWPNRKGALPQSYISQYQARDSCFTAGKRLCSSEEWSLACSGPYSWNYPYGQEYERYACVTHDTTVRPSGSKPECRAFFGVFDMSGNLLEWTSTPSKDNPQFFNVMGGFWQSGPRSGCFDIRYSYFPQNRHNPVGFRCCKDIEPSKK
ncbi:MAG: SUMF1/EgtB/PvdO family nonheme iron enzyme [Chitinispirillaceae bacterium]